MPDEVKRLRDERIKQWVDRIIVEAGASPPPDPRTVIKRKTAELAAMMALLHGGDWHAVVDPKGRYVLVSLRPRALQNLK